MLAESEPTPPPLTQRCAGWALQCLSPPVPQPSSASALQCIGPPVHQPSSASALQCHAARSLLIANQSQQGDPSPAPLTRAEFQWAWRPPFATVPSSSRLRGQANLLGQLPGRVSTISKVFAPPVQSPRFYLWAPVSISFCNTCNSCDSGQLTKQIPYPYTREKKRVLTGNCIGWKSFYRVASWPVGQSHNYRRGFQVYPPKNTSVLNAWRADTCGNLQNTS